MRNKTNSRPIFENPNTHIRERNLAFYDLEFSGLDLKNEIIQIGCVLVSQPDLKIIKEWEVKVKPEHIRNADKNSLKIVGYSAEEWKDAMPKKKALREFNDLVKNAVLVGYNSVWDFLFLKKELHEEKIKASFHWQTLDLLSMSFITLYKKRLKGFRMKEIVEYLDIKPEKVHDALDDARSTYLIFLKLMGHGK